MATNFGATAEVTDKDFFSEIFGSQEVPEDVEKTTQKVTNQEIEPEQEVPAEAPQEEEVEEQDEAPEEESVEEEHWFPESIDQLADALDVDVDALKAIKVKTKVDGVESDVPLGEVIKNYQINKSLTERSEALAHMRKAFESEIGTFSQQRDAQLAQWNTWNQILEQRLPEQVGAVDWEQLRQDDPAEYAARRQEFMERIGEIEAMKQGLAQQAQQQNQERLLAYQQVLQQNQAKLPELIPEYSDSEFMKKDMNEVKQYLLSSGFDEAEVGSVYDARHVAVARKAMLYDQMQKKVEPKQKLMKDKPRFIKPSARQTPEESSKNTERKKLSLAKKTQSIDAWASVMMDRL